MTYAEWKAKRHDDPSIFEMYYRKNPFKGKYAIFCGHDEVLSFLSTFKFKQEHLEFLQSMIPQAEKEFFEWLA